MQDLFRAAERKNIKIEYARLPINKSMSSQIDDGCCVIMDYSLMWMVAVERVHLAHELGHCVTGALYNPYSAYNIRAKHETRADKWAIKKLVPKDELEEAVSEGNTECWQLAEYFGVTCEFMAKAIMYYNHLI